MTFKKCLGWHHHSSLSNKYEHKYKDNAAVVVTLMPSDMAYMLEHLLLQKVHPGPQKSAQ